MSVIALLPEVILSKLVVKRQEVLSSLPSTVYKASFSKVCFIKVYTFKGSDPNEPEKHFVSDFHAMMLLQVGAERQIKVLINKINPEDPDEYRIERKTYPELRKFVTKDVPNPAYKNFENSDLIPYEYAKRMYELIVENGLKLSLTTANAPEKMRFFTSSVLFMIWRGFADLYNDYAIKVGDKQLTQVKMANTVYILEVDELAREGLEPAGSLLRPIARTIAEHIDSNGVVTPAGSLAPLDRSKTPQYFKKVVLEGDLKKEYIDNNAKALLYEYGLVPNNYDWTVVREAHPEQLIKFISTCILLLMHKPNNNAANTAKFLESRKKGFFNSINDPNEAKIKITHIMTEADVVEASRYLKFFPDFYQQLYSLVLSDSDPWTSYARTLLANSQATMFNLIFKFLAAATKTKLHTFQEVLYESTIWKQKYDAVRGLLPQDLIKYYKLYYPNGRETDCNDLGQLCVAAFTWYCYKESVTAGSMTNYGMARNYFSKHFLRMAMTPVPDQMYGDASLSKLEDFQLALEDLPGWNIDLKQLLKKNAKGEKIIVFEDVDQNQLDDFFTQFTSKLPPVARGP